VGGIEEDAPKAHRPHLLQAQDRRRLRVAVTRGVGVGVLRLRRLDRRRRAVRPEEGGGPGRAHPTNAPDPEPQNEGPDQGLQNEGPGQIRDAGDADPTLRMNDDLNPAENCHVNQMTIESTLVYFFDRVQTC